MRFGLCCLFYQEPIKFRTVTAFNLKKEKISKGDPLFYLSSLILDNIHSLQKAILYCAANQIGCFRIVSGLFPLFTHPTFRYQLSLLPHHEKILEALAHCKELARVHQIRLVFHPDQFVILNSPQEKVLKNSISELEYHGMMADLLGADTINIHAGGVYGNKKEALDRFVKNLSLLSPQVREKLTVENDDKSYTPQDLLPYCLKEGLPLVYDVHHHRCLKDNLTIEEATREALKTWNREPIFHLSSPKEGWNGPKPERHHDYIDAQDFPDIWKTIQPLTIEIEAKAKELAIKKLIHDLRIE